jgi:hypothetical protein
MSKVFYGVDDLIDDALGVTCIGTSAPHYRHKKAALLLRSRPESLDTPKLLRQIMTRIHSNLADPQARWRTKGGSEENWRWEKKLDFSYRLHVDEKTVEKLVALNCGECWVNQVPTASGLMDKSSDRLCNIDLALKTAARCYEFIELKLDDSTPLFAAFEIVKYALLFLISRERREEFNYSEESNPLLWASSVHLIVLGPPEYYAPFFLRWLEEEIDKTFVSLSTPEMALRFAFERTPWPHDNDYLTALMSRHPVYALEAHSI